MRSVRVLLADDVHESCTRRSGESDVGDEAFEEPPGRVTRGVDYPRRLTTTGSARR